MTNYILFDTETTGIEDTDRIIQVGGIFITQAGEVEVIDELCQTNQLIPFEAMEVHGITPEYLSQKAKVPYNETAFSQKINSLNNEENYLVAHNLSFDLKMIEKEGFECKMKKIDSLRCARHLYPDENRHRLQYLRYSLGLYKQEEEEAKKLNVIIKAHDAIGDVLIMKLLLRDMIQKVKSLYPNVNIMDKLAELTATPVLLKKFTFGKYKDRLISEVSQEDMGYLNWMLKNTDCNEDMEYTLKHYLKK